MVRDLLQGREMDYTYGVTKYTKIKRWVSISLLFYLTDSFKAASVPARF